MNIEFNELSIGRITDETNFVVQETSDETSFTLKLFELPNQLGELVGTTVNLWKLCDDGYWENAESVRFPDLEPNIVIESWGLYNNYNECIGCNNFDYPIKTDSQYNTVFMWEKGDVRINPVGYR